MSTESGRLRVQQAPEHLEVMLPRYLGRLEALGLLLGLGLWLGAEALFCLPLMQGHHGPLAVTAALVPALLILAPLLVCLAALGRREVITAEPAGLTLSRTGPRLPWTCFLWGEIEDLRPVPSIAEMTQQAQQALEVAGQLGVQLPSFLQRPLSWGGRLSGRFGPGTLQFRYRGKTHRFGSGLTDQEARRLMDLLQPWIPLRPEAVAPGPLGGLGAVLNLLQGQVSD